MQKTKVLIVDDEHAIRRFLRTSLGAHGYEVYEAATGEDAILKTVNIRPDLIILDLGLPGINGIEVTRRIREWTPTPIIILSVQNQDTDKIEALDAGADDYLTKPFSVGELTARLRVALRHAYREQEEPELVFTSGQLKVDLTARVVTYDGEEVQLTPTEYDLLRVLIHYAGRVLTHQQLLKEVRGAGFQTETHLLRVHMSNLRRKIEEDPSNPQYILTEPGVGYRLKIDI
ncbi:MAG: response regulator [Ardenticatenaceae bacterium]|nr:response regulator [Ardenticatenaceae bacterium]MCB9442798.1 response regulator [Ardenticatenaceae bacterium]